MTLDIYRFTFTTRFGPFMSSNTYSFFLSFLTYYISLKLSYEKLIIIQPILLFHLIMHPVKQLPSLFHHLHLVLMFEFWSDFPDSGPVLSSIHHLIVSCFVKSSSVLRWQIPKHKRSTYQPTGTYNRFSYVHMLNNVQPRFTPPSHIYTSLKASL